MRRYSNSKGKECICEICTCGRHHCPHKAKHYPTGPCVLSEYKNRYRPFPITLRESFKPKCNLHTSEAPLEDQTIHRIDYVPQKLEKPFERERDVYQKPEQPLDAETSYKQNYTGKYAAPVKAIKHDMLKKPTGKFDGEPSYRSDYKKWDIDRRKSYGPSKDYVPSGVKFDGQSTQRNDFPGFTDRPRESCKPNRCWVPPSEPLGDLTDYRHSYIKHPIPQKYQRIQDVYKGPTVPMDGLSTQRRDYLGRQAPKVASCKPDTGRTGSEAPLDDMTTCRSDYRAWPQQEINKYKHPTYVKPEGDMEGMTTYKNYYRPTKGDRAHTCKPVPPRRASGEFCGTTNYLTEFRKWDGVEPPKPIMKPKMFVSDQPFDGISTQRAHFVGYPDAKKQDSCKPKGSLMGSDAPFDDSTQYRTEYVPKAQIPCPVLELGQTQSKWRYYGEDDRGHIFYKNKYIASLSNPSLNTLPPIEVAAA